MSEVKAVGRTGFWILVGLLAASGVTMAFIVVFGMFDSVAYSIVWRVFVADLYLIASLAAQHRWLRLTAWIGTGIVFALGMVNVFWRFTPYGRWAEGRSSITVGDESTGWSPWFGFEADLEYAAHLLLVGVIVLGFVSLAHRWVAGERVLRAVYVFTFASGLLAVLLGAVLILDTPHRLDLGDWFGQLQAGVTILALTAAAIVAIAAFVQRRSAQQGVPESVERAAGPSAPSADQTLAALTPEQLRALVRQYVDERLAEREH